MKKVKKILIILGVIAALFLTYKCLLAGHTIPILKQNSISEYQMVTLGGVQQSILIRGSDRSNPILLYIHGGPGNPETSFIVSYQKEWEDYYTVVNWDQRGAGRSYNNEIDQDMLTTDQICSDAIELTQYLKEQFQVDKIYIVAHSYGTYVGMKCIQQNPEDYYAYVGIGQIGNQQNNEEYLLSYAVQMAKEHNNEEALSELSTLGDLPYTKQDFGNKISLSRKWTTYYGGAIYGDSNTNRFNVEAILSPEYSLFDLIHYIKGVNLYYTDTENDHARWELFNANLPEEIPTVDIPIYFIQGKNDFIVSFQACQEYYDKLQAPYKELIPIQNCAHNPIVEHTDEVSNILINKVLEKGSNS
jgi:pimeloyl-ACP methyl ester carboxylesterase